jgi:hypothetical protein
MAHNRLHIVHKSPFATFVKYRAAIAARKRSRARDYHRLVVKMTSENAFLGQLGSS